MSNRYTSLPNDPRSDRNAQHEMEAAFDDDSEDDEVSETHPLTQNIRSTTPPPPPNSNSRVPGSYDFENVDYDYPPPGSPPAPSAFALPNSYGNSNGLIPTFELDSPPAAPRGNWVSRTFSTVLPSRYRERLGYTPVRTGAIGGGNRNDGVFANVTAKPSRPVTIQDGDETYVVPEDSRNEAPPSYSSAQADAVPPYWETTVHAPFTSDSVGEMIIDNLPTGSLFSFLWNMLVSISFQFVGFLLTYLLHTTHAARLGSRAGLGITLIQYGFALRSRLEGGPGEENPWDETWRVGEDRPPFPTAAEASSNNFYKNYNSSSMDNSTMPGLTDEQATILVADATTEWLSFFLMTVGWFILLTSLLGFWRVKRWERNILATQQNPSDTPRSGRSRLEQAFGLNGTSGADFFRQGFGLRTRQPEDDIEAHPEVHPEANVNEDADESDLMLNISPDDPNRVRLIAEALANERRLQNDLRAAGLL